MHIALYQPDIAASTGAIARLGACLACPVHIIEPAGFDPSDRAMRRAGLDYLAHADLRRHRSFAAFEAWRTAEARRLALFTTSGRTRYADFAFDATDVLLFGRESAGVPATVHAAAAARLVIPLAPGRRSLNVATAAAMALGEALRQTGGFAPRPDGSC